MSKFQKRSSNHLAWLNLWISVLAVVIPLGLSAMDWLKGPILVIACWAIALIAISHLIWINPLLKNTLVKVGMILVVIFAFGHLSVLALNKKYITLSDIASVPEKQLSKQQEEDLKNIDTLVGESKDFIGDFSSDSNPSTEKLKQVYKWVAQLKNRVPTQYAKYVKDEGAIDKFYEANAKSTGDDPCNQPGINSTNQYISGLCIYTNVLEIIQAEMKEEYKVDK